MAVDTYILGIQIKQKELTKIFRMILNKKKHLWILGLNSNVSALVGLIIIQGV